MEQKEIYTHKSEFKLQPHDNSPGILTGWVTRFGLLSSDRGGYQDTFASTAFSNIADDDIRALKNHVDDDYLGRISNNTLQLMLSDEGLQFKLILPDTQVGRDTAFLCNRQDIKGCSFGYVPDQFTWNEGETMPYRQHTSGRLTEISVVYDPAFEETEVILSSDTPASAESLESLKSYLKSKSDTPRLNRSKQLLKIALL